MPKSSRTQNGPLVSCIISNYNYGQYVGEAIQSVIAQSHQNIEIIVVDDGSTDDSLAILKKFGKTISLVTQTNQGVVCARNNGAKQAKGEYIFFLDADDVIKPEYISSVLLAIKQEQATFGYTDTELFDKHQALITAEPWNPRKLLYRNYINASAIIERKAFEQVGGFSVEVNQKASFEDWDLWLSFAEQGYTGAYVPKSLMMYRLHGKGRNVAALAQRRQLEQILEKRHPKLYQNFTNKLYLAIFRSASRLRNAIIKPPGTA